MSRYAIYWAPSADHPVARMAAEWFAAPEAQAHTEDPRRYGLHATLKPPFRPAVPLDRLVERFDGFCSGRRPFLLPPLRLAAIGRFLALVPAQRSPELHALADACVTELDDLRLPADEAEIAKRRGAGLPPRQDEYLLRWGYPYVLEEFRFHVTLTGRLSDADRAWIEPRLAEAARAFGEDPVPVEELCLFEEPALGAPFREIRRTRLGAAGS